MTPSLGWRQTWPHRVQSARLTVSSQRWVIAAYSSPLNVSGLAVGPAQLLAVYPEQLCTLVPSGVRGQGQDSFVLATLCIWAKIEPPWASISSLVNQMLRVPLADPPRRTQSVLQQAQLSIWLSWTEGPCPDSDWGCGRCSGRFPMPQQQYQNGESEESHAQFLKALQNAVTTFVNRMKSNHVRGRSITNDSAVLSLFQSINTMHPQLLELLNQLDERRRMCHAHPPRCPSRASGLPSGACHIH